MFSSRNIMVSGLIFKTLIHIELIFFEWCKIAVQFHFFKDFFQNLEKLDHFWKTMYCSGTKYKNIIDKLKWVHK